MSALTKAHEGQHGTLKVGASTLVGTVSRVYLPAKTSLGYATFTVDGFTTPQRIAHDELVEFTPDAPPLPTEPGTVIAIGEWWLVRLAPWEGEGDGCWELLAPRRESVVRKMQSIDVMAQCVYTDEWVRAEAEQEGSFRIISQPVDEAAVS